MDVFVIFGLTFGGAGFVMAIYSWIEIGKIQRRIEAQRKELEDLKKQLSGTNE